MVTPQFTACDGQDINLTSLVPVGDEIYGITVAKLNSFGGHTAEYLYTDCGGESEEEIGWADPATNEMITDATIAPGEGLWVGASSDKVVLQSSGAVGMKEAKFQLCAGNSASGNPFPTTVKVADLYFEGGAIPYGTTIAKLNSFGGHTAEYLYTDCGGESEEEIGWVDPATNELTTDVINPGEGLWINAESSDLYLVFPAPEL